MLSRKNEIALQLNQLVDSLLLGVALWIAHLLRSSNMIVLDSFGQVPPFLNFLWMLVVIMPFGPLLLEFQGFYHHPLEKSVANSLNQIARAGVWLVLMLGAAVIFLRIEVPSRSVLILFCVLAPAALLVKERVLVHRKLSRLKRGDSGERIILAGEVDQMQAIVDSFTPTQKLEIRVAASINLEKDGVEALTEALHRESVGRVVLAFNRLRLEAVQKAIEACEVEGVEAWLSADFIQTSVARPSFENLGRRPMLVFRATPEISWPMMVKDGIDRLGAAAGLVVLSPLFLVTALMVRFSSPGPILFRQKRAGIHGRPFTMLKFRTMSTDAEARHADLLEQNEMSGPVFKIRNDPRITPIGKLLRKTSFDELPQLWNVLRGEMSLVGPRPLPLYEVERFQHAAHRRRLSMKPGLTCLWQVRGRNAVTSFDEWVEMDLEYIDSWSLGLDFTIILRTVPAVLRGAGAR